MSPTHPHLKSVFKYRGYSFYPNQCLYQSSLFSFNALTTNNISLHVTHEQKAEIYDTMPIAYRQFILHCDEEGNVLTRSDKCVERTAGELFLFVGLY